MARIWPHGLLHSPRCRKNMLRSRSSAFPLRLCSSLPRQHTMRRNSQSIALQDYRSLLSDGNIPAKTSKDTKHNCWGEFFWTVEILSCACATIILGALVILLAHFDDLPMPDWPQPITINAIVSTFTVAFKALLLKPLEEGMHSLHSWYVGAPTLIQSLDRT